MIIFYISSASLKTKPCSLYVVAYGMKRDFQRVEDIRKQEKTGAGFRNKNHRYILIAMIKIICYSCIFVVILIALVFGFAYRYFLCGFPSGWSTMILPDEMPPGEWLPLRVLIFLLLVEVFISGFLIGTLVMIWFCSSCM
ncbi:hypothetical protein XS28_22990 [Salmonella enterica subsp. enterica]|nr:hypothetical protein [Salmonella enterica subsp. enterica]